MKSLWRPIAEPVLDMPLAVCDTRSVRRDDCIAVDNVKLGEYIGEGQDLQHNARQRFHYISEQTSGEPWLLYMGEQNPQDPTRESQGQEWAGILQMLANSHLLFSGVPHAAFPLPTVRNPTHGRASK